MSAENPPTPERLSHVPEDAETIEWDQVHPPFELDEAELKERSRAESYEQLEPAQVPKNETLRLWLKEEKDKKTAAEILDKLIKNSGEKTIEWDQVRPPLELDEAELKERARAESYEQNDNEFHIEHDKHQHDGHGRKLKPWQKQALDAGGVVAWTALSIMFIGDIFAWNLIKNLWVEGLAWFKKGTGGLFSGSSKKSGGTPRAPSGGGGH